MFQGNKSYTIGNSDSSEIGQQLQGKYVFTVGYAAELRMWVLSVENFPNSPDTSLEKQGLSLLEGMSIQSCTKMRFFNPLRI